MCFYPDGAAIVFVNQIERHAVVHTHSNTRHQVVTDVNEPHFIKAFTIFLFSPICLHLFLFVDTIRIVSPYNKFLYPSKFHWV